MKKFIMLTAFIGILFASGIASAEIQPVIKSGSSQPRVAEVQKALNKCNNNNLVVDGLWGPNTLYATKTFQKSIGLSPVGYVGPKTAKALNDCYYGQSNPIPNPTAPVLCPNGMTLASNCSMPPYTQNNLCPNGMTIVSNCTLPGSVPLCPNGMTLASNCLYPYQSGNNSGQIGQEGTLVSIVKIGAYNSTKVYENDKDVAVLGLKATARDADQRVEGVVVSFKNTDNSSNSKIFRYASEISVWMNGEEIGRKSTTNYSQESSGVYTYRFTGMNGLIKKDQSNELIIAVSGVPTIDSQDALNDNWDVSFGYSTTASESNFISAVSSNGRYRDYGNDVTGTTFTSTIDFARAGGINSSQRFRITPAANNPTDQLTQVSETSNTLDKLLLSFDAQAEGGSMVLQKLPVTLSTTSSGDGVVPNTVAIVRNIKLYANGVKISDESIPAGSTSSTITFGQYSKLGYILNSNETVRFEIRADYNDIDAGTGSSDTEFDNGDKLSAVIGSTELANARIELNNYNLDTVQNRTGSVISGVQTLRSSGLIITLGSVTSSASTNSAGEVISRTFSIPVKVRALDNTLYLGNTIENALSPSGTQSFGFVFEDASGSLKSITHSVTLASQNAPVQSGAFRIDSGTEKDFVITVVASGNTGESLKLYRIQLGFVNSYTNATLTDNQNLQELAPSNAYETSYYTLSLN